MSRSACSVRTDLHFDVLAQDVFDRIVSTSGSELENRPPSASSIPLAISLRRMRSLFGLRRPCRASRRAARRGPLRSAGRNPRLPLHLRRIGYLFGEADIHRGHGSSYVCPQHTCRMPLAKPANSSLTKSSAGRCRRLTRTEPRIFGPRPACARIKALHVGAALAMHQQAEAVAAGRAAPAAPRPGRAPGCRRLAARRAASRGMAFRFGAGLPR